MKKVIYIILFFTLYSCKSKDEKIKSIIEDSYFGVHALVKMKDLNILNDNLLSLPVHYTMIEEYNEVNKDGEYEIVRYMYKTESGVFRIFYIVSLNNEMIIYKSSNENEFFIPIIKKIFGDRIDPELYLGNDLIELM
jgi:hypothetical protein